MLPASNFFNFRPPLEGEKEQEEKQNAYDNGLITNLFYVYIYMVMSTKIINTVIQSM